MVVLGDLLPSEKSKTDFYLFYPDCATGLIDFKLAMSLPQRINQVILFKDRIICDNYIFRYQAGTLSLVQNFNADNFSQHEVSGLCHINEEYLLMTFKAYQKFALYKYDAQSGLYSLFRQKKLIKTDQRENYLTLVKKDKFNTDYYGCLVSIKTLVQRLTLDLEKPEIFDCQPLTRSTPKVFIIDYRQLDASGQLLVLYPFASIIYDSHSQTPIKVNNLLQNPQNTLVYGSNCLVWEEDWGVVMGDGERWQGVKGLTRQDSN